MTGRRPDGYHLLDSLVMFASVGDDLSARGASQTCLHITGPEAAGVPTGASNSILRAAEQGLPKDAKAQFELIKRLPSAAGIGGGTADAAATLRMIHDIWPDGPAAALFPGMDPFDIPKPQLDAIMANVAPLGADVPVCLHARSAFMRGIGEDIILLDALPTLDAVLVNPRVEVATGSVFKAMTKIDNPAMEPLPAALGAQEFTTWLSRQRNDMQTAASKIAPDIETTLARLAGTTGCALARMSGSGATCFGLYASARAAATAAEAISRAHPEWWVQPCRLG